MPAREVLEVILQSVVYGGNVVVDFGLKIFVPLAEEFGVLEALRAEQPALEQRDTERSIEAGARRAGIRTMRAIRAATR